MSFDFYEELHTSQIREPELKALCGVSSRTIQRWLKNNDCPEYARSLIRCYRYDLGFLHPRWRDCYIASKTGLLWLRDSPRPYSVGDLNVLHHHWPKLYWYYEVWLKEQPNPEAYAIINEDKSNIVQFELPFKNKVAV